MDRGTNAKDMIMNKELNKTLSVEYRDPVTDNDVIFKIIDDWTFTLTYDTPVYNLLFKKDSFLKLSQTFESSFEILYLPT